VKLRVVAVGTIKERAARTLIDEYARRIGRYTTFEEVELDAGRPGQQVAAFARATEGATVIALDVGGQVLSSRELARQLERHASRGKGVVAFLIGGADGLPRAVLDGADARWSLSALTLPHRLARLILVEQLYRALTILRGEPYDH
jgi:23S rRNA (pseudouridine1915-N3)-methyltransferase